MLLRFKVLFGRIWPQTGKIAAFPCASYVAEGAHPAPAPLPVVDKVCLAKRSLGGLLDFGTCFLQA